ncbi:MAG: hypothetical protein HY656_03565 [Acidobacteria bacterium]|nr:hypothetical protein [Acidobacteriota bacterium]
MFKVTPVGEVSKVLESSWPWAPSGVAVAGGHLYVIERLGNFYGPSGILSVIPRTGWLFGTPRVRKVSSDGTVTTLVRVR